MEDKSLYSSQPQSGISEDFRQFIKETIEEVLVEGRVFDIQKRWLRRLGETEGVDCNALERNMADIIEVMEEWKQLKSKSGERMARMLGKECYLTEQDIDGLLQKLDGGSQTANPTQDASLMGGSQSAEDEYISECIKEVCIKGDSLSKYQKIIEKKFGIEYYKKCEGFLEETKRSVDKKKFTDTSVTNLHYLARQIGVSDTTVDDIVKHFTDKFKEEERQRQAAERRKQEEARRKTEEEARRAREEAERRAREEAERKAREEAERKAREEMMKKSMPPQSLDFNVKGVAFKMIRVDGGSFPMGCNDSKEERPVHSVGLSPFYIGETTVTQALWKAVMGTNPSSTKGETLPLIDVDWYDTVEFCNKLSKMLGKIPCYHIEKNCVDPSNNNSPYIDEKRWLVQRVAEGNGFRLPTEAEWEYAARGGTRSRGYKYSGSNNIEEVAWYNGNSRERLKKKVHPVKMKVGNELGLYDMSGNVWEWCEDWHGGYYGGDQFNPKGAPNGIARVLRGGSWYNIVDLCRVTSRTCRWPQSSGDSGGVRIVL